MSAPGMVPTDDFSKRDTGSTQSIPIFPTTLELTLGRFFACPKGENKLSGARTETKPEFR